MVICLEQSANELYGRDVMEPAKIRIHQILILCLKSDFSRNHGLAILYKLKGRTQPSALVAQPKS